MIKVNKRKDSQNYDIIDIITEEGFFTILFAGNLDLYFSYYGKDFREKQYHSFVIDKDNYFLYKCFDNLYDAIICEQPFKNGFISFNKYSLEHLYYPLVKDGVIGWHSDDGLYDEAAVLFIEKLDESYKLTIKEGLMSDIHKETASVRFRNSGSRYAP